MCCGIKVGIESRGRERAGPKYCVQLGIPRIVVVGILRFDRREATAEEHFHVAAALSVAMQRFEPPQFGKLKASETSHILGLAVGIGLRCDGRNINHGLPTRGVDSRGVDRDDIPLPIARLIVHIRSVDPHEFADPATVVFRHITEIDPRSGGAVQFARLHRCFRTVDPQVDLIVGKEKASVGSNTAAIRADFCRGKRLPILGEVQRSEGLKALGVAH